MLVHTMTRRRACRRVTCRLGEGCMLRRGSELAEMLAKRLVRQSPSLPQSRGLMNHERERRHKCFWDSCLT